MPVASTPCPCDLVDIDLRAKRPFGYSKQIINHSVHQQASRTCNDLRRGYQATDVRLGSELIWWDISMGNGDFDNGMDK